jgi:fluoroquinolone resistance protein
MDKFAAEEYQERSFRDLKVHSSTVQGVVFSECTFQQCSLTDNDFESCYFYRCVFQGCDLSLSRVNNCSFIETSFKDSKLIGINWVDAHWPKGRLLPSIAFEACAINHSVFMGLILPKMAILKCTAWEVDFTEADLREADFRFTDLQRSRFFQTNLSGADFRGARSYTISASANTIKGAKFSLPEAMSLLYSLDIVLDENDMSA